MRAFGCACAPSKGGFCGGCDRRRLLKQDLSSSSTEIDSQAVWSNAAEKVVDGKDAGNTDGKKTVSQKYDEVLNVYIKPDI